MNERGGNHSGLHPAVVRRDRVAQEAPAGGRAERSCTHAQCFSSRLAFLKPVDSFVVSGQSSSASRSDILSGFTRRGRKRAARNATENDQPFAQATSAWSGHWLEASELSTCSLLTSVDHYFLVSSSSGSRSRRSLLQLLVCKNNKDG